MEARCPSCGKPVPQAGKGYYCPYCAASLVNVQDNGIIQAEEVVSYYSPWDDRENLGFFKALFDTWVQAILNPVKFFSKMPPEGGIGGPLLYGFIMGEIGLLVALVWQGMSVFVPSFLHYESMDYIAAPMAGMTFLFFFSPILVIVGLFIAAAVLHLCLLLVGVAGRGFETTFRVVCYASSTHLLMLLPFCGGMIGGIWNLVLQIIGLREAHETTTVRSVLAVFLPAIICCGITFLGVTVFLSRFRCGY
jgi:hypothetical protein